MATRLWERLFPKKPEDDRSFLRDLLTGGFYRISDLRSSSDVANIQTQIETMRALSTDSQISTALSYYATDATITNSTGDIIWAVATDESEKEVADIVNALFKRWDVNSYARDHILELATIGNLYLPTTDLYRDSVTESYQINVALDNNTMPDTVFDIVPSYKVPPQDIIHIFKKGIDYGYILNPEEDKSDYIIYPPSSVIHFSLGGLLGEYSIDILEDDGNTSTYDIKFAQPLMEKAVQPTQTLGLLEDALLLSSLIKTIRIVAVEVGTTEEEETVRETLAELKDTIEQQLSLNTSTGDVQSYVNPQSPNNLIYVPMVNGNTPIQITDLNMSDTSEAESDLLNYYQDKKLSVLGVPKEAMNFSSNEGLGGAGSVLSQRSALYANALQRLETAYMNGWKTAINTYFIRKNMSGMVDKFELHMQPIVTPLSEVVSTKRDSAVSQASQLVELLKSLGIKTAETYKSAIIEALSEEFPEISSEAMSWDVDMSEGDNVDEF